MRILLFILLNALCLDFFAQVVHGGLEFSQTEFYFQGKSNWVSRVDSIVVTNRTNKKIHLLQQHYPREFQLRFPGRAIQPGTSEVIELIYTPRNTGRFDQEVEIWHSASLTPLKVRFHGNVLSFDEFAIDACPNFEKQNLRPLQFNFEIKVLDSISEKPIANADLEIHRSEAFMQTKTDAFGSKMIYTGIDYYEILASKPHYESKVFAGHVNPRTKTINIKLPPVNAKPITTEPLKEIPDSNLIAVIPPSAPLPQLPPPAEPSDFSSKKFKYNNIVFLIDRSMSMRGPDRMPLLKKSMTALFEMLRPEDKVSIIAYSSQSKVWLSGVSGANKDSLNQVVAALTCAGRTEGGAAMQVAYKHAHQHMIKNGVNHVILATDGGFNGLAEKEDELNQMVQKYADEGIRLSVLSFGENRYGKQVIKDLSDKGRGFYQFIATEQDAELLLKSQIREHSIH